MKAKSIKYKIETYYSSLLSDIVNNFLNTGTLNHEIRSATFLLYIICQQSAKLPICMQLLLRDRLIVLMMIIIVQQLC